MKKLLEEDTTVNCKVANGKTPLIIASECGHIDIVKKLLEKGVDVSCKDANGKTAIDLTSSRLQESLRDVIQFTYMRDVMQLTLWEQGGLTTDELKTTSLTVTTIQ